MKSGMATVEPQPHHGASLRSDFGAERRHKRHEVVPLNVTAVGLLKERVHRLLVPSVHSYIVLQCDTTSKCRSTSLSCTERSGLRGLEKTATLRTQTRVHVLLLRNKACHLLPG